MIKTNTQKSADLISRWETPRFIDSPANENDSALPQSESEIKQHAHEEGLRLGYQAGMEQAAKEMNERTLVIEHFLDSLTQPFKDQNHRLVEDIATLAGKIAKSLVRRELRTEPETIMALVHDTVSALNTTTQHIDIHLNPKNARIIREIINIDSLEKSWNIIDDPLISQSDCKVNYQDSIIDADLQTRINLIITQFLGDERNENRK